MATTKLTDKSIIRVVNNTTGSLSFYDNDEKKHSFPRKNSFKDMELSKIEGVYNSSPNLIEHGHIVFKDKRVYDYLGMPEEVYSKLLTLEDIEKILVEETDVKLKEIIEEVPKSVKENIAKVAKEKGIDSKKKVKAIKEVTGFDVGEDEE